MKKLTLSLFVVCGAAVCSAQIQDVQQQQSAPPGGGAGSQSSSGDRTVTGDWTKVDEQYTDWIQYDHETGKTTLKEGATGFIHQINGKLHLAPLPADRWLNNYYLNKKTGVGTPHAEKIKAGTLMWFDESNNPICKASCKNPQGFTRGVQAQVQKQIDQFYYQREHITRFERQVDHYHTEYRDVPYPEYHMVRVFGPQNQNIGQLGAPTVVQGGGGGGFAINFGTRINVNANGYGAAAAAAAAAAATGVGVTGPNGTGVGTGGSSGTSGSAAGGGPSHSGSH